MRRVLRANGGLAAGALVIVLLVGCAAPGDVAVVRNPAQFTFGTDGDGLPDTQLAPPDSAPPAAGTVIDLDGQLWRIQEVFLVDPVLHSTLVTASLENVMSGEIVTRTLDAATLAAVVER